MFPYLNSSTTLKQLKNLQNFFQDIFLLTPYGHVAYKPQKYDLKFQKLFFSDDFFQLCYHLSSNVSFLYVGTHVLKTSKIGFYLNLTSFSWFQINFAFFHDFSSLLYLKDTSLKTFKNMFKISRQIRKSSSSFHDFYSLLYLKTTSRKTLKNMI